MEHRKHERLATSGQVAYSIGETDYRDELYNLSLEGCMIATDDQRASVGDKIAISLLDGVVAKGAVVWTGQEAFGVRFESPVGEATVRYFRLTDWSEIPHDAPADAFGRTLPPLAGTFRRA